MKQEKKLILNTQGYRGTRDFYPEDIRLRSFLYEKIRKTIESFGYEEYDGPLMEPLELYASKSSEEIVKNQLYTLIDKGERTLAIRPEMTPTLARMVAAKYKELSKPVRWYSIPTCMRFERPQRGRLREFNQLNVDIFGGNPFDEDIEVLLTIIQIFKTLGASLEDFEIYVNHRGLVNDFFSQTLKLQNKDEQALFRLLDKKDKLSNEEFLKSCADLSLTEEQISKLKKFLNADLNDISQFFTANNIFLQEIKERIHFLETFTQSNCVKFSPTISRGFDYYTGIVFEVFDTHPKNRRSLFGGGRFDNLIAAFGTYALSGIGYGVSDVALFNFMEVHQLLPNLKKDIDVCILRFNESDRLVQLELAQRLRIKDLNIECIITDQKFGKQMAYANRLAAKAVAFRGEDEIKKNTFVVKWLKTGEQFEYEYSEGGIAEFYISFLKT